MIIGGIDFSKSQDEGVNLYIITSAQGCFFEKDILELFEEKHKAKLINYDTECHFQGEFNDIELQRIKNESYYCQISL